MIHRALFGSVERFFAILLEHYAGALPTWLMPVQVVVLPVRDEPRRLRPRGGRHCCAAGVRVEVDTADEPLSARIRRWKMEKVPYILVVGDDDVAAHTVGVNARGSDDTSARRAPRRVRRRWWPRSSARDRLSGRRRQADEPAMNSGSAMSEGGLEQLWAGWRHEYVVSATAAERRDEDGGCVFCRIAASGPPSVDNCVVWRSDLTLAVLNAYPYASGHLLVMPVRHVGALERPRRGRVGRPVGGDRATPWRPSPAYDPDGLNMGANLGRAAGAGIPEHLHLHVLPRWSGDTNFMTSVAGVRVIPESLTVGWRRLHEVWPQA